MSQSNNGSTFFGGPRAESGREGLFGGQLPVGDWAPFRNWYPRWLRIVQGRRPSLAVSRAIWFVALYSVSLLSFGALVGSVRWTLALV